MAPGSGAGSESGEVGTEVGGCGGGVAMVGGFQGKYLLEHLYRRGGVAGIVEGDT